MELRWYQTYDKNGVDSEVFLQWKDYDGTWQYVDFIREREKDEDN